MSQAYIVRNDPSILSCLDVAGFQNKMTNIRKFDDKIINILNDAIPTESFYSKKGKPADICKQFRGELGEYYDTREAAILKCIDHAQKEVSLLKSTDDISEVREKNRNLRIFKQELDIESIIKERSFKAVNERCSRYM